MREKLAVGIAVIDDPLNVIKRFQVILWKKIRILGIRNERGECVVHIARQDVARRRCTELIAKIEIGCKFRIQMHYGHWYMLLGYDSAVSVVRPTEYTVLVSDGENILLQRRGRGQCKPSHGWMVTGFEDLTVYFGHVFGLPGVKLGLDALVNSLGCTDMIFELIHLPVCAILWGICHESSEVKRLTSQLKTGAIT